MPPFDYVDSEYGLNGTISILNGDSFFGDAGVIYYTFNPKQEQREPSTVPSYQYSESYVSKPSSDLTTRLLVAGSILLIIIGAFTPIPGDEAFGLALLAGA